MASRDIPDDVEKTYPCLVEHNAVVQCNHHAIYGDGCAVFGHDNVVYGTSCLVIGERNVVAGMGAKYLEGTQTHFRIPTCMVSSRRLPRSWVWDQLEYSTDFGRRFPAFLRELCPPPPGSIREEILMGRFHHENRPRDEVKQMERLERQPHVPEVDRDVMLEQVLRSSMQSECGNLSFLSRGQPVAQRISAMSRASAAAAPSVRIEITTQSQAPSHVQHRAEPTFLHINENRVRSMLFGPPRVAPTPPPLHDPTRTIVWSRQCGLTPLARRLPSEKEEDVPKAFQCSICLVRAKATLCRPCNHSCFCISCVRDVVRDSNQIQCPICRASVDEVLKIY